MHRKYTHLERWGNSEVQGIEVGECYIFPKIDGTNASVWWDGEKICTGSRSRKLTIENDNAGFHAWAIKHVPFLNFFAEYPNLRLYGEWLVPHSLKTYRLDAWRKFYVFDVEHKDNTGEDHDYFHYNDYYLKLNFYNLDYIAPIKIIQNPTYEMLLLELEKNTFLIEEGEGCGEGISIKNYNYENQWGRNCFAKLVTNEFKDKHSKEMGAPKVINKMVEDEIVNTYVTKALCDKVHAKIVNEMEGWKSQYIPRLLQTVYYDLVNEEIWNIVKKMKQPTINFRTLNTCVIMEVKRLLPELF